MAGGPTRGRIGGDGRRSSGPEPHPDGVADAAGGRVIRFVPRPPAPADRPARRSTASDPGAPDTAPAALPAAEVVRPDFLHHHPPHQGTAHAGPIHGHPAHGGSDLHAHLHADAAGHEADDPADDYRDRMVANLAGLAVLAMLIAGGLWIALTMADQRKNQDCVLSGRPGCTPVPVPAPKLPPGP